MKKLTALLLACAMILTLAACSPAKEGGDTQNPGSSGSTDYPTADNPLTIKLGHVGPPDSSLDQSAQYIAEYINEKTEGAIKVEVYPQGQLGDAIVMMDGLTNGILECAMVGANELATMIPDFYVLCLPFLFNDFPEFFTVANDEELLEKFDSLTTEKGFHTLGFTSGVIRGFNNSKHTVRTVDDCAGLKIRIMSGSIYVDIFEAMGCSTSTMAFNELYSALQQGVVDGEDNDPDMMVTMKFMEVEKYHTELNCTVQSNPLLISNECWNKLSPEQQQIFMDAVNSWIDGYLDLFNANQEERLATLEENGVEITYLTDEEKQTFIDATADVYDKYAADVDADLYNAVLERVEEYRGG